MTCGEGKNASNSFINLNKPMHENSCIGFTLNKVNMKKKLLKSIILLILTFIFINIHAQKNVPEISFGILNANIKTFIVDWNRGSAWRKGAWVSLNQNHKIYKWLHLDTGLTYQERMPLEVFTFHWGWGLGEGVSGVSARFTYGKWPTNPQNEKFDSDDRYVRFPNFKYLNVEMVPNITIGNTFSFTIGAGLFGGVLLNRKENTITKEYFPTAASDFGPPNNVNGEVTYHRYDSGFMPKVAINYKINDKIKVGLQFKSYHSFIRLNDTFVTERNLALNMRWIAHAGGLSMQYKF